MGRSKKEKGSNGIMGCMSGMLQLFDFRQEAIDPPHISQANTLNPARPPPDDAASTEGTEAPRDSHERLTTAKDCLLENRQSHQLYEDDDIPMGFEIFTRSEAAPKTPISPKMKSKNPNAVARLMGIEVLPDETETEGKERIAMDSTSDSTKNHNNKNSNRNVFDPREKKFKELNRELRILERCENIILGQSRSLPETPRISSARRSDVDRRLSVQIQKENVPPFINNNYADRGRLPASPTSSTSSYSLRNLDTKRKNCSSNAENKPTSPRLVLSSNSPRLAKPLSRDSNLTPSCSPRLRYRTEDCTIIKTKPKPSLENQTNLSSPRGSPKPRVCPQPFVRESSKSSRATKETRLKNTIRENKPKFEVEFVKRINSSDLLSRESGKVRSPKRIKESYVRVVKANVEKKKGQKTIFDSLVMMKKEARSVILTTQNKDSPGLLRTRSTSLAPSPASPAITSPALDDGHVIQDDAFSHHVHAHTYHQVAAPSSTPKKTCFNSHSPPLNKEREKKDTIFMYRCIKTILELMGLRSNTIVSFMHLYSPSHPLDPAIFTKLDAYHHHGHHRHDHVSMANTRSNKRLVFEFVDELLRQRLEACIIMHVRPWMMMGQHGCTMKAMTGRQLLRDVWMDVRSIPTKDCKIVQDIDALVASDVNTGRHSSPINDHDASSVAETILFRIEQEVADSLLCEAVVDFLSLKF